MIEKRDGQATHRLPVPTKGPAVACQPEPLVTLQRHDRRVTAGMLALMLGSRDTTAAERLPAGVTWVVITGFALAAIAFARNRMLTAAVLVVITLMIAGVAAVVRETSSAIHETTGSHALAAPDLARIPACRERR
jgi:hypothetical protein